MADAPDWMKWSAIGQIAAAAATFAAVVVSLYLARSATRAKAKISTGLRITVGGARNPNEQLIAFTVVNRGQRPLHVQMLGWRTGIWPFGWPRFLHRQTAIIPAWDTLHWGGEPPYELPPYRSRMSVQALDPLIEQISSWRGELWSQPFFARVWPIVGIRPTAIFAMVHLEEGLTLTHRVEQSLAKALYDAERDRWESSPGDMRNAGT